MGTCQSSLGNLFLSLSTSTEPEPDDHMAQLAAFGTIIKLPR